MAKIQHLHSETAGNIPSGLLRGQVAINIPDQIVYTTDPSGSVVQVSNAAQGASNVSSLLGVHIPTNFMPVAQLGPGLSQAVLQTRFSDNGTTASCTNLPIFAMGKLWWTGNLSCPSSSGGAYQVTIDTVNRVATLTAATPASNSGNINYGTGVITVVVYSNATIYPWFYVPTFSNAGTAVLLRISPVQVFGAIPVSSGFAGAAATSYWGS